jgi:hypothetical protein
MNSRFDTERWAARRRPFDAFERRIVHMHLDKPFAMWCRSRA